MYQSLLSCVYGLTLVVLNPPTDPLDQLATAIVESHQRIERLLCDAYMFNTRKGQPDQALRVVHAAARDRRFLEIIHHTSPSLPPWHDRFRNQSWRDPRKAVMFKLFGRTAYYGEPAERDLDNPLYGDCLAWRQPGEVQLRYVIGGRRFALIDVFAREQRPTLRLLPEPEVWAGLTCQVVVADGGRDRLWICPERGHALVHRVWQPSGERRGAEFTCSDFEQVGPGLWLPKTCECVFRPLGGEGEPPSSYRLEVVHVAVNSKVPDSQFEPHFLPGTEVFGASGKLEASIPGGTDLLDLWVAVLLNIFPPVRPADVGPSTADLVWITTGSVLLVGGLALWFRSAPGVRSLTRRLQVPPRSLKPCPQA